MKGLQMILECSSAQYIPSEVEWLSEYHFMLIQPKNDAPY